MHKFQVLMKKLNVKELFMLGESKWNIFTIFTYAFTVMFSLAYILVQLNIGRIHRMHTYDWWYWTIPFIVILTWLYITLLRRLESRVLIVFALLIIALVPRLLWVIVSPAVQVSDFATYMNLAARAMEGDFSWTGYPENHIASFGFSWFLSIFGQIFGLNALSIKIFNAFVNALLAPILYLTGQYIFEDRKIGISAGVLIAFFPSHILFNAMTGNQVLATTLGFAAVLLCLLALKRESIKFGISGGVCFAFADLIRSADTFIMIFAGTVFVVLLIIKKGCTVGFKRKLLLPVIIPIVAIAMSYFVVDFVIFQYASVRGHHNFDAGHTHLSGGGMWYAIAVGQNVETIGRRDRVISEAARTMPADEFRILSLYRTRNAFRDPNFFRMHVRKFTIAWANWYTYWLEATVHEYSNYLLVFVSIERGYWLFLGILLLLSTFCLLKKPISHPIHLYVIVIAGYVALIVLVMLNERYRYTAEVAIILLAAFGFNFGIECISTICRYIYRNSKSDRMIK